MAARCLRKSTRSFLSQSHYSLLEARRNRAPEKCKVARPNPYDDNSCASSKSVLIANSLMSAIWLLRETLSEGTPSNNDWSRFVDRAQLVVDEGVFVKPLSAQDSDVLLERRNSWRLLCRHTLRSTLAQRISRLSWPTLYLLKLAECQKSNQKSGQRITNLDYNCESVAAAQLWQQRFARVRHKTVLILPSLPMAVLGFEGTLAML